MPTLQAALRYWHTLRHLRPVQLYGRLWFRLARPRPVLTPAPEPRPAAHAWAGPGREPSLLAPCRLRLLGVERELNGASDWNNPAWSKLWLYNAHYFDDLVADGAAARWDWQRDLLARWVAENPPAVGNGWEPYPTSLRVVNWVKWALAGNELAPEATQSLAVQVRHLRRRLEVHLLGNHLWANAKALVFAGAYFQGSEAERWRAKGLALLRREMNEQILPGGGHFEGSPMYHAILLEDVLDLVQLGSVYPGLFEDALVQRWRELGLRMLGWLRGLTHPDEDIAFFNDAAFGIASPPARLEAYAQALGLDPERAAAQPELDGYLRLERDSACLLFDAAPVGPDYLPGHAHADSLSLELSLFGQRVLVNSGTSVYGADAERQRQRGTLAHNTVALDGADSSEVWGGFRVARRAQICGRRFDAAAGTAEAAHDGYTRLPGRPLHRRRLELDAGELRIEDCIQGEGVHSVQGAWHLHPKVEVSGTAPDAVRLRVPTAGGSREVTLRVEGAALAVEDSSWHPRFGAALPNKRVIFRYDGALPVAIATRLEWPCGS